MPGMQQRIFHFRKRMREEKKADYKQKVQDKKDEIKASGQAFSLRRRAAEYSARRQWQRRLVHDFVNPS